MQLIKKPFLSQINVDDVSKTHFTSELVNELTASFRQKLQEVG